MWRSKRETVSLEQVDKTQRKVGQKQDSDNAARMPDILYVSGVFTVIDRIFFEWRIRVKSIRS